MTKKIDLQTTNKQISKWRSKYYMFALYIYYIGTCTFMYMFSVERLMNCKQILFLTLLSSC